MEDIRNLVERERAQALSHREWAHRLKGYGYSVAKTDVGVVVSSLPRGEVIMTL
ncbi:hypothetical protein IV417_08765 [Alphaproteobacteria bacterium KMM 3653]|uniref:Uncharacterized protein n=1 Tax=Harenicola maris TaxID=2841044 RepID=A0AAP2G827_9RHOB|nr:hypothetical protein [Harenicola maris]